VSGRTRLEALVVALAAGDLAALSGSLYAAYLLRFRYEILALERVHVVPFAEYLKPLAVLLLIVPVLFRLFDLYRTDGLHSGIDEIYAIAKAVSVGALVVLALTFFFRREGFQYSRLTFAYWWALSIASVAALHAGFRRHLRARFRAGLDRRRALVVGEPSAYLLEKLRTEPAFGVEVVGYVDLEEEECPGRGGGGGADVGEESGRAGVLTRSAVGARRASLVALPRLGAARELAAVLSRGGFDEAIIVEAGLTHRALLETIDACERARVEVRLIPPIYDLLVEPRDFAFVEGVPLVRIDEARFRRLSLAAKRAFDIAASGALLVLLAPLFAVLAMLIRRGSPGPAFFVQERAGEGGRPFRMLKFRTMVADAERRLGEVVALERLREPVFKLERDPRVTPIGRFLRRFSLDELPQLVNVLCGDMSMVGPRPEEARIVERYDVWQRRRLKVRPGITGLQQVLARGALSDLNERVRLDVYYVRKRSFLLDLVIMARTLFVVVSGRGAT
jgi:lipopolysaccharide/colanic/teichoic acid biosynthesis glycosyltransferase